LATSAANRLSDLSRACRQEFLTMNAAQPAFRFLILGAGRGGTSLLAGLLDAHPKLEVAFEAHARACLMGEQLPPECRGRGPTAGHDRGLAFRDACEGDAQRCPEHIWGNKITTEQLAGLEQTGIAAVDAWSIFFQDCLPDVPVLFILRDGRTCVRSKVQRAGLSPSEAAERWRYCVRVGEHVQRHCARSLTVRYEDLVGEPADVLGRTCQFLGVEYDPAMIAGTNNPKMPKIYRRDDIDASRLERDGVPPECLPLIADDLRRLGYAA
jgi:hypothetical protein